MGFYSLSLLHVAQALAIPLVRGVQAVGLQGRGEEKSPGFHALVRAIRMLVPCPEMN